MSLIKTPAQIDLMRQGGIILSNILNEVNDLIKANVDVWDLETQFINLCEKYEVRPACKGYTAENRMPPFPTGLCVYLNEQSVHCFPIKGRKLVDGDLITIDTVIEYKGMYLDSAFAKVIGNGDLQTNKLLKTTREALYEAEKKVADGVKTGVVANTMQRFVQANGFDVLRDYAGHGIGTHMHEAPEIPCYGFPSQGTILKSGMTICVEALVCEGNPEVENVSEWETKMRDNKRFLQFEHTILVTDNGFEVLTPLKV